MMSFKLHCYAEIFKINPKTLKIFIIALCLFFLSSVFNNILFAKSKSCDIYIINSQNNKIKLNAEIADTQDSRTKGLMFRKFLDKNSGMLFVFDHETILSFWMKNTYIPLSIAYVDKNGIIIDIHLMYPLDSSVVYTSRKKSMFAVEVNQGWFKKHNITEGCKLVLNGCLGKQN